MRDPSRNVPADTGDRSEPAGRRGRDTGMTTSMPNPRTPLLARRSAGRRAAARRTPLSISLRALTVAGLAVDAWVHADLASSYDPVRATVSQGELFRVEAGASALAALLLVVTANRLTWGWALLVAAAGVAAVLLYGYVDVGQMGPLPDMYEPLWFTEKTVSAVAEGVAAAAAVGGLAVAVGRHGRASTMPTPRSPRRHG